MIVFTQTDFPEPVAPAMSRCGIFARSAMTGLPSRSLPSAIGSAARAFWKSRRLDQLAEPHHLRRRIRHFDADRAASRDRRDDANTRRAHGEREIVREVRELAHLHARCGLDLELRHGRPRRAADQLAVDAKCAQRVHQPLPRSVEITSIGVGVARFRRSEKIRCREISVVEPLVRYVRRLDCGRDTILPSAAIASWSSSFLPARMAQTTTRRSPASPPARARAGAPATSACGHAAACRCRPALPPVPQSPPASHRDRPACESDSTKRGRGEHAHCKHEYEPGADGARDHRRVECDQAADDSGKHVALARCTHRERDAEWQHDHHAEQKDQPGAILSAAQPAEKSQRMNAEGNREQGGTRPAEHSYERPRHVKPTQPKLPPAAGTFGTRSSRAAPARRRERRRTAAARSPAARA